MTNAAERLAKILEVLAAGRTVYISTALRAIKITGKNVKQFEAAGRPLFKTDGKSLYISAGKRYDCIDYCKITVA
jgi:hypothetical protein